MTNIDLSSIVVHKLATILDSCKNVEEKTKDYLIKSDMKPDLVPELFEMLNSIDDLIEMVSPLDNPTKYFDLPKEAQYYGEKRITFKNIENPNWDFTAWYYEKISIAKKAIKRLIAYWMLDHDTLKLHQDAPFTPREYISEGIAFSLASVQSYTKKVFDQVFKDELEIREITQDEQIY